MPTLTLPTKIYVDSQLVLFGKFLKTTLKGLQVEAKICGVTSHSLVQVSVSGEDEKAALRYIADEVGLCPENLTELKKFSELKSHIISLERSKDQLLIDIGISTEATISLQYLQAQLVDGRKVALRKLADLFGFGDNLPLTIKIVSVDKNKNHVEAMFSKDHLVQYRSWTESLLNRLIILGAPVYDVRLALKEAGLNRDVLDIEPLGLFEHAVKCKLGTDAEGLIPKIGRKLRTATFKVFNPIKVLEFLDYSTGSISW